VTALLIAVALVVVVLLGALLAIVFIH